MASSFSQEDDLHEEYSTPAEVFNRLLQLLSNELNSPSLLPYDEAVVDCMVEQISHMHQNIIRLEAKLDPFCIEQHKCELDRYSFVVNKYFRTRMQKIESDSRSLIRMLQNNRKNASKLMSKEEIRFLDHYVTNIDAYMNESVLGRLSFTPTAAMSFKLLHVPDDDSIKYENTYVFVRVLRPTQVIVDDPITGQETIQLEKDSQHFLPFGSVRAHLFSGSRDLLLI